MANTSVEADQTSQQLMHVINQVVNDFTHHTPLSVEQIVLCLGYVTGRGLGHVEGRNPRRLLYDSVRATIEHGIAVTLEKNGTTGIIMPGIQ